MSQGVLQAHYEKKYGHEAYVSELGTIDQVDDPSTRYEAAVKYLPLYLKGGNVLELGAGNGAVAKTLIGLGLGIERYELGDISLSRVSGIARSIKDERIAIRHLDAEEIPDEDHGRYDAVIMIALIEHLIDPLRAMRSIRKLLKPGGFAYVDTPNIAKYTRRAQLLLGRFPSTASRNQGLTTYEGKPVDLHDEGHLHYFTYASLSGLLTGRCGFTRVDKLSYPCGRLLFGRRLESRLARAWPELFSELVLVAHN